MIQVLKSSAKKQRKIEKNSDKNLINNRRALVKQLTKAKKSLKKGLDEMKRHKREDSKNNYRSLNRKKDLTKVIRRKNLMLEKLSQLKPISALLARRRSQYRRRLPNHLANMNQTLRKNLIPKSLLNKSSLSS